MTHLIGYGQSLSRGYKATPCLPSYNDNNVLGFIVPHTYDKGCALGITKEEYNSNESYYDKILYSKGIKRYRERIGNVDYPYPSSIWSPQYPTMGETPMTGCIEAIRKYKDDGNILFITNNGQGANSIQNLSKGSSPYNNILKDVLYAKQIFDKKNLSYCVGCIFLWQGEQNTNGGEYTSQYTSKDVYKEYLKNLINDLNIDIKNITNQKKDIKLIIYQVKGFEGGSINSSSTIAIAQFECAQEYNNIIMASPVYPFETQSDNVHLTNISSRKLGNATGIRYAQLIDGVKADAITVNGVSVNDGYIYLFLNKKVIFDSQNFTNSTLKNYISDNHGFYLFKNGTNIVTSAEIIEDGTVIKLNISEEPTDNLYYGCKGIANSSTDNYPVLGGDVREDCSYKGYNDEIILSYMPVQKISIINSNYIIDSGIY